jgi:hypothetical protein
MLPITMQPHDTRSPISRPPVRLDAGSTAAVFTWVGDRWTHRITTGGDGEADGWTSLDGPSPADDPRWPASPVLVELSRVKLSRVDLPRAAPAGGSAMVGVGLAGRSHFSASMAPDPEVANSIRFEIACRLHEPPLWLGSTYRTGGLLFHLTALDEVTTLPRTVVWAYSIGPQGIFAVRGAAVSTGPA